VHGCRGAALGWPAQPAWLRPSSFFSSPIRALARRSERRADHDGRYRARRSPDDPPSGHSIHPSIDEIDMTKTTPEQNKALVLEAFDTLFNKRDYAAAERFWSPNYIQHSAHIPPGREGLFTLIKGLPDGFQYENGLTVANGEYVLLHGRFAGIGLPANWIVVDIVRLENGQLAEHWDVIQDEVTKEASVSGLPMFGDSFPSS
jgi:predicted SnoaL-like aldol condensation-catalyzing enzyme